MNLKSKNNGTLTEELAITGGLPVRKSTLPYGRQSINEADRQALLDVLDSDWLTTGPKVDEFERSFAHYVNSAHAVAVCNGTAALHAAIYALDIQPGDEVIVPSMTFAASANCVVYQGGTPVFADADKETLLLDPAQAEAKITSRTKAIIAVDYTGQACDYDAVQSIAERHGLRVLADACHALGGSYRERPVGSLADLSTFSFHPVKHLTTGEGGMITTNDPQFADRMRTFRNHGITTDHRQRSKQGGFFYEMVDLGYNYRLTDLQCALGLSQLSRVPEFISARRRIAAHYDAGFAELPAVRPLAVRPDVSHAYHLYVIQLELDQLTVNRAEIFAALRAEGIGVNVHYVPVHLHPFYRQRFGTGRGLCPVTEAAYERILTLPMFPQMTTADADDVIVAMRKVIENYSR